MATQSTPDVALHGCSYPSAECVGDSLSLRFFIPGKPVAKGRPRSRVSGIQAVAGGLWRGKPFVQVYTDAATVRWEEHVGACVRAQLHGMRDVIPAGRLPLDERLMVSTRFSFPRPQRPKFAFPMGRRDDFDNLVKLVLDALQPTKTWAGLIMNDGAVTDAYVSKRYAPGQDEVGTYLEVVALG